MYYVYVMEKFCSYEYLVLHLFEWRIKILSLGFGYDSILPVYTYVCIVYEY